VPAHQHVLRLDVAVDELALVGVLQGRPHLLHVGVELGEGDETAPGIALAQGAARSIVHHQEGHAFLHIVIQNAYNCGVRQLRDGLRFLLKVLCFLASQIRMQHLDGRLQLQPHVLAQVHFCIATLSQQRDQPEVAKLLSHPVCHLLPPFASEAVVHRLPD
jgi:hypothetical protein